MDQFNELKSILQHLESNQAITPEQQERLVSIEERDSIFPDINPDFWASGAHQHRAADRPHPPRRRSAGGKASARSRPVAQAASNVRLQPHRLTPRCCIQMHQLFHSPPNELFLQICRDEPGAPCLAFETWVDNP